MHAPGSGRQHTNAPVTIVLPDQRHVAPGRLAPLRFSKKQLQHQAQRREILVPIRLDIDADGYRLRDTFTWDLNNELIAPRQFAMCLCSDMELPAESFVMLIVQAIDEQLDDYARYAQAFDEDELRVVIRIDIIIGHIALRDQLEWDVAPLLRPLRVAHVLCAEKRLGGDFETSIAHAIREQLYAYAKSFLLADDMELARTVLPPVTTVIRDTVHSQTFSPLIAHLHTVDAERMEKDADREIRRKRR
ncbi:SWI/SNF-related matrix associated protein, partial [Coemansia reversa NRRL 1564]